MNAERVKAVGGAIGIVIVGAAVIIAVHTGRTPWVQLGAVGLAMLLAGVSIRKWVGPTAFNTDWISHVRCSLHVVYLCLGGPLWIIGGLARHEPIGASDGWALVATLVGALCLAAEVRDIRRWRHEEAEARRQQATRSEAHSLWELRGPR